MLLRQELVRTAEVFGIACGRHLKQPASQPADSQPTRLSSNSDNRVIPDMQELQRHCHSTQINLAAGEQA